MTDSSPDSGKKAAETVKSILVAVDGSVYSSNSLHYLANLFHDLPSVTIHLFSIIPHKVHDTQRGWVDEKNLHSVLDHGSRKVLITMETCMQQAVNMLTRNGFSEKQITMEIKLVRRNVVEDLLLEARKGVYDALLIGRRGLGVLQEMIMGSVSKNLLERCHDIPIWLIDGLVDSRKFLVPIDGTIHSLMAVDYLSFILHDNPYAEITLFNSPAMFKDKPKMLQEEGYALWGKEWCEDHLAHPECLFHAPTQMLMDSGIPEKHIHHLTSSIGIYPSRQIVRQALIDDFGTIVIGRRPAEVRKGFFGGVTYQVINMADQVALWIVG